MKLTEKENTRNDSTGIHCFSYESFEIKTEGRSPDLYHFYRPSHLRKANSGHLAIKTFLILTVA